jgi:hypothetical protein
MGNHEYCIDCGESDFHHGRPCDPVKVARIKAEKEAANRIMENKKTNTLTRLRQAGFHDFGRIGPVSVEVYFTDEAEQA